MLDLPGVTLVAADTAQPALALRALRLSQAGIRFARTVLLTDAPAGSLAIPPSVDVVSIAPLRSRDDYSRLMLKGLRENVATAHVLVVQWDGYVVNPDAFDDAFLACDYIGAKWFWYDDGHRVGNGGFSLRSRRLLDALADPRIEAGDAEDITIGRTARPLLESAHGIRFASESLADRFAFEAAYPIGRPFGFHGLFNFARVVPEAEIASLAPTFGDAIARSPQLAQLLRNCVALGQWTAAAALARRRLAAQPGDGEATALLAQAEANAARGPTGGRNDPCPCGSGKRYKQCHGAIGVAPGAPSAARDARATPASRSTADAPTPGPPAPTPLPPAAQAHALPADAAAALDRSLAAHQRGALDDAERGYRAVLAIAPGHPLALHYLGVLLYQRGQLDDAMPLLDRAVALVPGEAEFHNNRGLALTAADRLDEAVDAFRRALALRPAHAGTWNNLGLAEVARNALGEADAAYTQALALEPGFDFARWNHALALLAAGRYADGWRAYEARLSIPQFRPAEVPPQPRWDGATRPGLRVLVLAEQGLGDTLHFIRYARTLAERGIVVTAGVPDKLRALVATVPGVTAVRGRGAPWPAVDAWIPLLSLAGLLDVRPASPAIAAPYLAVDASRRQSAARAVHADAGGRTTVGLAWAGARENTNDRRRSIPLARLAPLLARTDVAFYSLQHDDDADVMSTPSAGSLHRLPARIGYDDMAALVDVLDLVVTVDTSIAHLAGALDRPVWILLPYGPDWRWGVTGDRTPWYASARLFRQPRIGDWASVVDAVGRALDDRRGGVT